jgi:signal transduction histidine kinase
LPNRPPTPAPSSQQGIDRLALTARLHETLAQDLAVLGFRLDELLADSTLGREHRAEIREIRLSIVEIIRQFRDDIYLTNNRSRDEMKVSLSHILEDVRFTIDLTYPPLQTQNERLLNEVLIELARNTARHSGAQTFEISYQSHADGIELLVSDDGLGLPSPSRKNLGLIMIDHSLRMIGCEYQCSSSLEGTIYRILIPRSMFLSETSI